MAPPPPSKSGGDGGELHGEELPAAGAALAALKRCLTSAGTAASSADVDKALQAHGVIAKFEQHAQTESWSTLLSAAGPLEDVVNALDVLGKCVPELAKPVEVAVEKKIRLLTGAGSDDAIVLPLRNGGYRVCWGHWRPGNVTLHEMGVVRGRPCPHTSIGKVKLASGKIAESEQLWWNGDGWYISVFGGGKWISELYHCKEKTVGDMLNHREGRYETTKKHGVPVTQPGVRWIATAGGWSSSRAKLPESAEEAAAARQAKEEAESAREAAADAKIAEKAKAEEEAAARQAKEEAESAREAAADAKIAEKAKAVEAVMLQQGTSRNVKPSQKVTNQVKLYTRRDYDRLERRSGEQNITIKSLQGQVKQLQATLDRYNKDKSCWIATQRETAALHRRQIEEVKRASRADVTAEVQTRRLRERTIGMLEREISRLSKLLDASGKARFVVHSATAVAVAQLTTATRYPVLGRRAADSTAQHRSAIDVASLQQEYKQQTKVLERKVATLESTNKHTKLQLVEAEKTISHLRTQAEKAQSRLTYVIGTQNRPSSRAKRVPPIRPVVPVPERQSELLSASVVTQSSIAVHSTSPSTTGFNEGSAQGKDSATVTIDILSQIIHAKQPPTLDAILLTVSEQYRSTISSAYERLQALRNIRLAENEHVSKVQTLATNLKKAKTRASRAEQKVADAQSFVSRLERDLTREKERAAALANAVDRESTAKAKAVNRATAAKRRFDSLRAEHNTICNKLDALQKSQQTLHAEEDTKSEQILHDLRAKLLVANSAADDAKKEVTLLSEREAACQTKVTQLTTELELVRSKLEQTTHSQQENLSKTTSSMTTQLNEVRTELLDSTRAYSGLKVEFEVQKKLNTELKAALVDAESRAQSQDKMLQSLTSQLSEVEVKLAREQATVSHIQPKESPPPLPEPPLISGAELAELKDKLEVLRTERDKALVDLDFTKRGLEDAAAERDRVQGLLVAMQTDFAAELKQHKESLRQQEQREAELSTARANDSQIMFQLKEDLSAVINRVPKLAAQAEHSTPAVINGSDTLQAAKAQIIVLQSEIEEMHGKISSADCARAQACAAADKAVADVAEAKLALRKECKKHEDLQQELEAIKKMHDEKSKALKHAELEIESLRTEAHFSNNVNEKLTAVNSERDALISQLKELESKLTAASSDNLLTLQQLSKSEAQVAHLTQQVKDMESQFANKIIEKRSTDSEQLNIAKEKAKQLEDKVSMLQSQMDTQSREGERELSEAMSERSRLTTQVKQLEDRLGVVTSASLLTEHQLSETKAKVAQQAAEMDMLKKQLDSSQSSQTIRPLVADGGFPMSDSIQTQQKRQSLEEIQPIHRETVDTTDADISHDQKRLIEAIIEAHYSSGNAFCVVKFDYEPEANRAQDELALKKGQILKLTHMGDEGFFVGSAILTTTATEGLIPSNFVDVIDQEEEMSHKMCAMVASGQVSFDALVDALDEEEEEEEVESSLALALYDRSASVRDELSFSTGQVLLLHGECRPDGFFIGERDGNTGLVPANYIAIINTDTLDSANSMIECFVLAEERTVSIERSRLDFPSDTEEFA